MHFTQWFTGGSQNYSQWKLHWQFKGIIRSIRLQQLRRVIHFLHLCHNHNAQSSHQEIVALRPLVRVLTNSPQRHPGSRQEYALQSWLWGPSQISCKFNRMCVQNCHPLLPKPSINIIFEFLIYCGGEILGFPEKYCFCASEANLYQRWFNWCCRWVQECCQEDYWYWRV